MQTGRNQNVQKWLWILTLLGVVAAIPFGISRMQMERTSRQIEYLFDYRDLVTISSYQARKDDYLKSQLLVLKRAGITTMVVSESTLSDLATAGRLVLYTEQEANQLKGNPPNHNQNFTYLLFEGSEEARQLTFMIKYRFDKEGIVVRTWMHGGKTGLMLETPIENATLKTMEPDPIAIEQLLNEGFKIMPRLSDRDRPYNPVETERMLAKFQNLGVNRILFEGDAVKGYGDNIINKNKSIENFASLLNKHGIGLATIENLNKPELGFNALARLTNYNVVRLLSLSEKDAARMKPEAITDRFLLAAKDRNIRMFYINGMAIKDTAKASITDSVENVYKTLVGKNGVVETLRMFGFPPGEAKMFSVHPPISYKWIKILVSIGAIALMALLLGTFVSNMYLPAFLAGLIGSVGLYFISTTWLDLGLALGAGISAPTLALIWSLKRIRSYWGRGSSIGNGHLTFKKSGANQKNEVNWSSGYRLLIAMSLFIILSLISMLGFPFIIGILSDITYNLRLEQFRGVGMLHLVPIALVTLYALLYMQRSVGENLRRLLTMKITFLWVVVGVLVSIAGLYYLSRTGNAGTVSSFELMFRTTLEEKFGVRPRTKEFLLAHPLLLLGLFLSLRYRFGWIFMVVGTIGQLSMIDTIAHLHTPLKISLTRVFLGLGIGFLIGLVLIALWQLSERILSRYSAKRRFIGRVGKYMN
ncbi:DUF5693 family protein [Paenibacillus sp. B01]|uniref:DUF5693 family protein n=1 Tax=Paenibacillus sp. B01 TaxID=2660554 RepID=UPI00129BBAB4|nr:DUF5693 family protein [Paenibacillus sp. B01]QGG55047.1 hypothetical protein GE073_05260 [Paenibacillus sp. B01]